MLSNSSSRAAHGQAHSKGHPPRAATAQETSDRRGNLYCCCQDAGSAPQGPKPHRNRASQVVCSGSCQRHPNVFRRRGSFLPRRALRCPWQRRPPGDDDGNDDESPPRSSPVPMPSCSETKGAPWCIAARLSAVNVCNEGMSSPIRGPFKTPWFSWLQSAAASNVIPFPDLYPFYPPEPSFGGSTVSLKGQPFNSPPPPSPPPPPSFSSPASGTPVSRIASVNLQPLLCEH